MKERDGRQRRSSGIGNAFLGKIPPHDEKAEAGVLGAVLVRATSLDRIDDLLEPDDFYSEAHGMIYQAMKDLRSHRTPIDLRTLSKTLKWKGEFEAVGGPAYLSQIINDVPTSANVRAHAQIVADAAAVRAMLGAALDVLEKGYGDFGDATEFVQEAEAAVMRAARRKERAEVFQLGRVTAELFDELARARNRDGDKAADLGLLTGIPGLDKMTSGLQPGEVCVIAGPSSSGKTSLALQLGETVPAVVLLNQLEQPCRQLAYRALAARSGRPIQRLRRPGEWSERDLQVIGDAAMEAARVRLLVDDRPALTPTQLRGMGRRQVAENGIGMHVWDYIGQVRADPSLIRAGREQQMAHAIREAKREARELGIVVVVVAQLNRAYTKRNDPRPQLEDLRESGSIGHEADTVLFTWRPEASKADRKTNSEGLEESEIIVGKCRNGATGTVPTWWDGVRMRWKERAFEGDRPPQLRDRDEVDDLFGDMETTG